MDGKNEDELREILRGKELVYVEGGNTFYLMKAIRESGFEKVIKELLPKGLIYMSVSAGAYVACPTIEMAGLQYQDKYNRYFRTLFTGHLYLCKIGYSSQTKLAIKDTNGYFH